MPTTAFRFVAFGSTLLLHLFLAHPTPASAQSYGHRIVDQWQEKPELVEHFTGLRARGLPEPWALASVRIAFYRLHRLNLGAYESWAEISPRIYRYVDASEFLPILRNHLAQLHATTAPRFRRGIPIFKAITERTHLSLWQLHTLAQRYARRVLGLRDLAIHADPNPEQWVFPIPSFDEPNLDSFRKVAFSGLALIHVPLDNPPRSADGEPVEADRVPGHDLSHATATRKLLAFNPKGLNWLLRWDAWVETLTPALQRTARLVEFFYIHERPVNVWGSRRELYGTGPSQRLRNPRDLGAWLDAGTTVEDVLEFWPVAEWHLKILTSSDDGLATLRVDLPVLAPDKILMTMLAQLTRWLEASDSRLALLDLGYAETNEITDFFTRVDDFRRFDRFNPLQEFWDFQAALKRQCELPGIALPPSASSQKAISNTLRYRKSLWAKIKSCQEVFTKKFFGRRFLSSPDAADPS